MLCYIISYHIISYYIILYYIALYSIWIHFLIPFQHKKEKTVLENRCALKCDLSETGINPASNLGKKAEVTLGYPFWDCKAPALCKACELDTFLWDQGVCYSAASCCWLRHLSHISNDGWIWSLHKECWGHSCTPPRLITGSLEPCCVGERKKRNLHAFVLPDLK